MAMVAMAVMVAIPDMVMAAITTTTITTTMTVIITIITIINRIIIVMSRQLLPLRPRFILIRL